MGWGLSDIKDRVKQVAGSATNKARQVSLAVERRVSDKVESAIKAVNPLGALSKPASSAFVGVLRDAANAIATPPATRGPADVALNFSAFVPGLTTNAAGSNPRAAPALVTQDEGSQDSFVKATIAARDDLTPVEETRLREIRDEYVAEYGDTIVAWPRSSRYGEEGLGPDHQVLGHDDVGKILTDLAERDDLTETEKTIVFDFLVDDVTSNGNVGRGDLSQDGAYAFTADGADPVVINDGLSGHQTTDVHTLVPLDDRYHTRLAVEATPQEALEEILENEAPRNTGGGLRGILRPLEPFLVGNGFVNEADINSSVRSVGAMRVLDETGDFGAFAEEWNRQMLDNGEEGRYVYDGTDPANIPRRAQEGLERVERDLLDRLTPDIRFF